MNPNYKHVLTIYNRLRSKDSNDQREHWQSTILEHCFYKAQTIEVQSGTEAKKTNSYTVRIPEDDRYLPYNQWKALSAEERTVHFTVSEGDIVIKGRCTDDITGTSPATAAGLLSAHKPDAFQVTAFSDNTSHLMGGHYRIGG